MNARFRHESMRARKRLFAQVNIENQKPGDSYLTYQGILPIRLPDGMRVVILPDVHAPAHNAQIFWGILQFLSWFRPHIVIFLGDVIDMFSVSTWPKSARFNLNPQHELDQTRELIREVMRTGVLWTVVIDGNHEDRMQRLLMKVAPMLSHFTDRFTRQPVTALPNLMGFTSEDPITFITAADQRGGFEGGLLVNDQLKIEHGELVKPVPGDSARAHLLRTNCSTVMGHTHRFGSLAYTTAGDGSVRQAMELGCLIDFTHPSFGYAHEHNWHHGFGAAVVLNGRLHVQPLPIIQAEDDSGQLRYFFQYAGKQFQSDVQ